MMDAMMRNTAQTSVAPLTPDHRERLDGVTAA
jgi:hypothetical protein